MALAQETCILISIFFVVSFYKYLARLLSFTFCTEMTAVCMSFLQVVSLLSAGTQYNEFCSQAVLIIPL